MAQSWQEIQAEMDAEGDSRTVGAKKSAPKAAQSLEEIQAEMDNPPAVPLAKSSTRMAAKGAIPGYYKDPITGEDISAFVTNFGRGATGNLIKYPIAGIDYGTQRLSGGKPNWQDTLNQTQQSFDVQAAAHPGASLGGQVAGGFVPGGLIGKGAQGMKLLAGGNKVMQTVLPVAGRIGGNAAYGAVDATASNRDPVTGAWLGAAAALPGEILAAGTKAVQTAGKKGAEGIFTDRIRGINQERQSTLNALRGQKIDTSKFSPADIDFLGQKMTKDPINWIDNLNPADKKGLLKGKLDKKMLNVFDTSAERILHNAATRGDEWVGGPIARQRVAKAALWPATKEFAKDVAISGISSAPGLAFGSPWMAAGGGVIGALGSQAWKSGAELGRLMPTALATIPPKALQRTAALGTAASQFAPAATAPITESLMPQEQEPAAQAEPPKSRWERLRDMGEEALRKYRDW